MRKCSERVATLLNFYIALTQHTLMLVVTKIYSIVTIVNSRLFLNVNELDLAVKLKLQKFTEIGKVFIQVTW